MKKTIIAIALLAMLVLLLGCAKTSNNANNGATNNQASNISTNTSTGLNETDIGNPEPLNDQQPDMNSEIPTEPVVDENLGTGGTGLAPSDVGDTSEGSDMQPDLNNDTPEEPAV